jgi:PAS domain S-box-containing protein
VHEDEGKHGELEEAGGISLSSKGKCKKPPVTRSGPPHPVGPADGKSSILIVDDDTILRKTLTLIFRKHGYETEPAVTGQEAIEKAKERFFNVALLDIKLSDMEGIDLLKPLKEMHPDMAVIMITGFASLETAVRALHEGASAYITKPLKQNELLATTHEVLEKQRLVAEKEWAEEAMRESEERFRTLVANAPIGLSVIAKDGTYEYVNPKFIEMFGYTREDISTGNEWFEKAYPDPAYRRKAASCWVEDIKGGEVGETRPRVFTVTCKNASKREILFRPVTLSDGRQLITYEDITEGKRAEEALQREKHALQRLAEEREVVAEIGRTISSSLEIDKVYESFAREVTKVVPFDRIGINIIYPKRRTTSTAYITGAEIPGRRAGDVLPLAGSLTGEVMRTRSSQLLQTEDIDGMGARFPALLPTFQAGFRSLMAVPLISKDRVIGVLHLRSFKPKAYSQADVNLAESIGAQIAGAIANAQLYAEHKRAEEELGRKARELTRSNAELEQFAYVASHDLQEPLRKIQAFGDRLKTHCHHALDERGRDYLQRMQNAARRMQSLINDLLTFSRVTTRGQPFVPVNLTEVAEEVVSDLEAHIQRTGGRVEVGDLPTIEADPVQERQLLQNLIDNGLKFHRPEEAPVVKVNGKLLDDRCEITVQDNGIGFDEKYLDRIFTIFQRLHARFEYEGTGVGLALCRKIAERHGGNITAQSTPGKGATFIVTLSVKQPKGEREGLYNG